MSLDRVRDADALRIAQHFSAGMPIRIKVKKPVKRAPDTEPLAVASGSLVRPAAAVKTNRLIAFPKKIESLARLLPQAVLYRSVVRGPDALKIAPTSGRDALMKVKSP
jgi:hypothetical protein